MKKHDKEDKILLKQRLREKRTKKKMKLKRSRDDESEEYDDEEDGSKGPDKRQKIYYHSDSDDGKERLQMDGPDFASSLSVDAQVDLALQLLNKVNS